MNALSSARAGAGLKTTVNPKLCRPPQATVDQDRHSRRQGRVAGNVGALSCYLVASSA